ncbi:MULTISPECIES: hypothetical protein [unclassified Pseudomonas]|uniref:hypothetical protein n=1 Tax=unclassified Pseudomonas TaxID=196821 RepID=UPI00131AF645|nr:MULTISPECIES: hypothetical protein [unclassified Pseudomonas]
MSSREEFEEWYANAYPGGLSTGAMKLAFEELAYASWQASRQALVVELPAKIGHLPYNQTRSGRANPEAEQYDEAIDDCREAIEAAGVRVKP